MSDRAHYTSPNLCFVDLDYQEDGAGNSMQQEYITATALYS